MRQGKGGIDRQRRPVLGDGLGGLAPGEQGHPQVAVGLGVVRIEPQRLAVMNNGLRGPALLEEHHSQVVVCFRERRP